MIKYTKQIKKHAFVLMVKICIIKKKTDKTPCYMKIKDNSLQNVQLRHMNMFFDIP